MRRFLMVCAAVGVNGMVVSAYAADQPAKEEVHELEQIGVTGKRIMEPATSPYAVTESSKPQTETWTRDDIDAIQPETLWDVVQHAAGMEVTYQGRQHMYFSNARGTGSYGIILDGVYLTQTDRLLASIPTDAIESMTFVRDATALSIGPLTNFGSGTGSSNQGFLVVKTKRAAKLEGGLIAGYGSYNTHKEEISIGDKIGDFDFRLSLNNNRSSGREDWNMAYRNNSVLLRSGYTGRLFNADLTFYKGWGRREMEFGLIAVPTYNAKNKTYDWSKVGTLSVSNFNLYKIDPTLVAFNLEIPWSKTQTTTFQYAFNYLDVLTTSDQDSQGQNISLRHVATFANNTLRVGAQYLTYLSPGQAPNNIYTHEGMVGAYLTDEHRLFDNRLTIDAGIRMDKKYYFMSPSTGKRMGQWADQTMTYTIGAALKLIPMLTLTGRYAYSENPEAGDYQISVTGSKLPDERRSRFELGLLASVHQAFNPWVTLYYYDTKNQKVSATGIDPNTGQNASSYIDPATGNEVDYVQASNVRTKGAEFGVSGDFLKHFNYRIQYSYVMSNNHSQNASMSHQFVSAMFGCHYGGYFANVNYRYVGPKSLSTSPVGQIYYALGDYSRVDVNVGYKTKLFNRDAKITAYGKNLNNEHYSTRYVTGLYRDPGIQAGAEVAFSFF